MLPTEFDNTDFFFDRMDRAIISSNGSVVSFAMGIIAQVPPPAHQTLSKAMEAVVAKHEVALITTGTQGQHWHLLPLGGANLIWKSTVHQVKHYRDFFNSFWPFRSSFLLEQAFILFVAKVYENLCCLTGSLYQNPIVLDILGKLATSWGIRMKDARGISLKPRF